MNTFDATFGSLSAQFKIFDAVGFVTIHPEMIKVQGGISPTGRYHVHCIHPLNGSCMFKVEQDDKGTWICNRHPDFISMCFISWIGDRIMKRSQWWYDQQ